MCTSKFSDRLAENINFAKDSVSFGDEAMFYVNGVVNRQNLRYWYQENSF